MLNCCTEKSSVFNLFYPEQDFFPYTSSCIKTDAQFLNRVHYLASYISCLIDDNKFRYCYQYLLLSEHSLLSLN